MNPSMCLAAAAVPYLVVLGWCDWRTRRLPNVLTLGGALVVLVWRAGWGGWPCLAGGLLGGVIAGALLLIPFLLRAAGAGDLKYLFTGGLLVGFPAVFPMLFLTSVCGLILGIVMQVCGRLDPARVKHLVRSVFDWRYDRAEGRKNLPGKESESVRIPFGVAISCGIGLTLLLRLLGEAAQ